MYFSKIAVLTAVVALGLAAPAAVNDGTLESTFGPEISGLINSQISFSVMPIRGRFTA